ncbi:hypothetical protein C4D60_Mb01t30350 [Musa balbisiana]|uniref:Uncharacterized protein n=1 Tax=Musa balbisiana TaxID=52838 RepID=A0A4S8JRU4_MUSBA|nr:hypothetical protein C4D60_Mb01t30350 [Musa balbisiana]
MASYAFRLVVDLLHEECSNSEMHWCCCYNKRQSTILLMDCETVRSHCISIYLQGLMYVALGRSPRRSGEARRGPSASLLSQAARFKQAPPGRSPEPRRWALRASAWVNQGDRTRILGLVRSWFGC